MSSALPPHQTLITGLLHKAGIGADVRSVDVIAGRGITNLVSRIVLQDGRRFAVRVYRWPYAGGDDTERMRKEVFLHSLLKEHGVPVADILAAIEDQGQSAVLMEYLPGELLGEVVGQLSERERREAWHSSGEMLRRAHTISYPPGTHGVLVGDKVRPFDAPSWGHFQVESILDHLERVRQRMPDVGASIDGLHDVLAEAIPILNRTPPALLHNDPHPWNVLVQSTPNGWQCSGWLDWEYAWVGDPNWDLVRMDLFRPKPIGPTPHAFWEGYGALPSEPERSIYEMFIYLWMANQYLDGDRQLIPTYEAAMNYVGRLDASLEQIRRLLAT